MKFDGNILILARESRGYTQKQLAERTGIAQGTVSKLEKNQYSPNDYILDLLSDALKYPKKFFTQEPLFKVKGFFRTKQSISGRDRNAYIAKMTLAERVFTSLQQAVELPETNIPSWDLEKDGGNPSMAALFVRNAWKIPKGRVDNLVELVEDNGIVVIMLDLGDMDAFSTYSDSRYPIIFLNNQRPSDRLRFNLAHELGHLVLHWGKKVVNRDYEEEAHEFASEFLMPMVDIKPYLQKLNVNGLTDLKRYWKTSMYSLAKKAKDLGTMSQDQYYYLMKGFSINGYRSLGEPELFEAEVPTLFRDIVDLYLTELGYTLEDMADMLNLNLTDMDELLFAKPKTFRVFRP